MSTVIRNSHDQLYRILGRWKERKRYEGVNVAEFQTVLQMMYLTLRDVIHPVLVRTSRCSDIISGVVNKLRVPHFGKVAVPLVAHD